MVDPRDLPHLLASSDSFCQETNRATAQTTQDASLAEGHAAILVMG